MPVLGEGNVSWDVMLGVTGLSHRLSMFDKFPSFWEPKLLINKGPESNCLWGLIEVCMPWAWVF